MKVKTYPIKVSTQIDVNFRNYALYVLENRGIPSFYDSLTNVQRFIVLNAPSSFNKTISLVGSCISDGYHHGDKSLTGAINKLAKPFGNSEQLLLGDGFFGTPINQEASAARYTSVKINPRISEMIRKSEFLNVKADEGWAPLWLDLPIGITNMIIGIAVGYKTTVLPRDLQDVQKFLDGEIKEVTPKFKNFKGTVKRYQGLNKSWLISGVTQVNESAKTVRVTELPPLMRYASFLKKLEKVVERFSVNMINNSSTNIDVLLQFRGNSDEWSEFLLSIDKSVKMLITETPVFIKDGLVIEYDRIEDYIEDYKYRLADLKLRRLKHFKNLNQDELLFLIYKEKYLIFMLSKGKMRSDEEVSQFLDSLSSGELANHPQVRRRLEAILLKSLTEQELQRVRERIKFLKEEIKRQEKEIAAAQKAFDKMVDTALKRATHNRSTSTANLFEEEDEIDGIEVFHQEEETEEE